MKYYISQCNHLFCYVTQLNIKIELKFDEEEFHEVIKRLITFYDSIILFTNIQIMQKIAFASA